MNKTTRKELSSYLDELDEIKESIQGIADDEQDKADNMPDNLQMSEKHDLYEEIAEKLNDAVSSLEEATDYIQEAIDS